MAFCITCDRPMEGTECIHCAGGPGILVPHRRGGIADLTVDLVAGAAIAVLLVGRPWQNVPGPPGWWWLTATLTAASGLAAGRLLNWISPSRAALVALFRLVGALPLLVVGIQGLVGLFRDRGAGGPVEGIAVALTAAMLCLQPRRADAPGFLRTTLSWRLLAAILGVGALAVSVAGALTGTDPWRPATTDAAVVLGRSIPLIAGWGCLLLLIVLPVIFGALRIPDWDGAIIGSGASLLAAAAVVVLFGWAPQGGGPFDASLYGSGLPALPIFAAATALGALPPVRAAAPVGGNSRVPQVRLIKLLVAGSVLAALGVCAGALIAAGNAAESFVGPTISLALAAAAALATGIGAVLFRRDLAPPAFAGWLCLTAGAALTTIRLVVVFIGSHSPAGSVGTGFAAERAGLPTLAGVAALTVLVTVGAALGRRPSTDQFPRVEHALPDQHSTPDQASLTEGTVR